MKQHLPTGPYSPSTHPAPNYTLPHQAHRLRGYFYGTVILRAFFITDKKLQCSNSTFNRHNGLDILNGYKTLFHNGVFSSKPTSRCTDGYKKEEDAKEAPMARRGHLIDQGKGSHPLYPPPRRMDPADSIPSPGTQYWPIMSTHRPHPGWRPHHGVRMRDGEVETWERRRMAA